MHTFFVKPKEIRSWPISFVTPRPKRTLLEAISNAYSGLKMAPEKLRFAITAFVTLLIIVHVIKDASREGGGVRY
jgi:hypothetical protein